MIADRWPGASPRDVMDWPEEMVYTALALMVDEAAIASNSESLAKVKSQGTANMAALGWS